MFTLISLPYASLEPVISDHTLSFHHGKHLQTYVDNLNKLIAGTEFEGKSLEEIIRSRLKGANSIGFASELGEATKTADEVLSQVTMDDLRKFGMIPEFIGRLPVLATLETLTAEYLVRILKEPKNAILKQYQKLMAMDEVKLEFEEEALQLIAEKAMKKETGARALRSILEEYMLDIMYEIPRDNAIGRVVITRDYLEGKGGPRIILRGMEQLPE